jgi:CAAX prenyl protease-like protein
MPYTSSSARTATIAYVAPFAVFIILLGLDRAIALPPEVFYPFRFVVVLLVLLFASRPFISLRPSYPVASIVVGAAVFLIWIAPDVLFGYRHHWLFENRLMGAAVSSMPPHLRSTVWFPLLRTLSSVTLVPILEELFWRGWLMRMLIGPDFQKVPLGAYAPSAFWLTAVLFASEHGAYWDVGLAAGIVYNWWIIRCKNLADCMLAHAVTNALLAAYILMAGRWEYWL